MYHELMEAECLICVFVKDTNIGTDCGLSPLRRQEIIWTIELLETNFSDILLKIKSFSFKKINLKMSSANCRPFCLGLNVF